MTPAALADLIRTQAGSLHETGGRFITALAGPPGAGKSTLAAALVAELGAGARVVPMDGFHYDNAVLDARGWRSRKGAPHTFDAHGFAHLVARLRAGGEVAIPVFDRAADLARAGADLVTDADRFLVIEGNYLLLDAEPWAACRAAYDLTVFIDVPVPELERRLIRRWLDHGMSDADARAWALSNDIPNARLVAAQSVAADVVISQG
ncbi:nucleoside triphosphate hydrolase [Fertoebacter nigrum]|uniref:Nucleoside triphosphate hydrolase n=1 Tax=Fertoeibacter niger TaxID=2656921 RepID=A0A8X8GYU9_9RHOB|nr:nucleoside triphosphate hydrolase [Fertoeibacter niger]NUB46779.1 nucleoside triphosphate hydrolase [Fertoeibacter niger]